MAEDLMCDRIRFGRPEKAQAGFSMIEMLMTAFVLAIGILGLTMLQTMSLKASRGSRSLSVAILVADQVMDQAEMEGRLSWLNFSDTNRAAASLNDLPNLKYITIPADGNLVETFNGKGGAVDGASGDPAINTVFYTVTTTRVPADAAVTGRISDISVTVQFADNVDQNAAPIQRTISLTRRIIHG